MKTMSSMKLFLSCLQEIRKTKKAMKQLHEMELTEEALQQLVNSVAFTNGEDVEIELQLKDGRSLIFRRQHHEYGTDNFKERFEKRRSNRGLPEAFGE